MRNLSHAKHAAVVGLFFVFLFVVCLLWRYTMTDPAVMQFHMLSLKTLIPGFKGYDAGSIIWGIVLTFVYGFLASTIYHSLHLDCCNNRK